MISSILFLLVIIIASTGVAVVFRRLGLVSEGVIAGVLVGVLFGPTVLGRIAPDFWDETVMGAIEARQAVDDAVSERQAFVIASGAAELGPEAQATGLIERDSVIGALAMAAAAEMLQHARPWSVATMALAAAALWLGWATAPSPRRERFDRTNRGTTVALAFWVILLPAVLAIALFKIMGREPDDPAVVLATIAVSAAAWPVAGQDARELVRLEVWPLVINTNVIASLLIVGLGLIALVLGSPAWSVAMLPLLVFGALHARFRSVRGRGRGRWVLRAVVLPSLGALCVLRSEVLLETPWIITIGLMLVAGDGRALAWLVGLRFTGMPAAASDSTSTSRSKSDDLPTPSVGWSTSMLASGASGPQLAFTAAAVSLGGIGPGLAFGLALGAAGLDLFGPSRRRIAGL